MRHLIDPWDFSKEETDALLALAERIEQNPSIYSSVAAGKRLATLFYEPSTRTRLSHETAMQKLGGFVIGFPSADVSSTRKGESVEDTIRVISCYADIAAMRHYREGAPALAAQFSRIPVINAGDGGNNHPTQTLLDMMTIKKRKGRLDDLTIGFCGDLKYGRTVHSLVKNLSRYRNIRFVFISPKELRIPGEMIDTYVKGAGMQYTEVENLEDTIGSLDILYMTRIQKERFLSEEDYLRFKGVYILDAEKMKMAKKNIAVLHPFPRVDEIAPEVDVDERAAYFEQIENGAYVRVALIMALLQIPDPVTGKFILQREESQHE